jgi:hypothetical protein
LSLMIQGLPGADFARAISTGGVGTLDLSWVFLVRV